MIKRFDDKTKDKLFYLPSVSGPEGKIPFAGQNYGADTRVKSFKEYSGEYRKGSMKFGNLINKIMEFLRLPEFKDKIDNNDGLRFERKDFEKRSNINTAEIEQLLNNEHNLYSFNINIDDKYITFSDINKTYKDRYVSGRK
jgi:hypothetical protein